MRHQAPLLDFFFPKTHRDNFKEFRTRSLEKARHTQAHIAAVHFGTHKNRPPRQCNPLQLHRSSICRIQSRGRPETVGEGNSQRQKKWAALKEAEACAREKNGVCTLRDREKRVCAICDECDMLREFANSIRQREASTNQ